MRSSSTRATTRWTEFVPMSTAARTFVTASTLSRPSWRCDASIVRGLWRSRRSATSPEGG
jgi:hypothetical protein